MKTIIKTTQLEFDKSDYLIDLVKHGNGMLYIEIEQSIIGVQGDNHSIKINPTVLPDIIKILSNYNSQILEDKIKVNNYISDLEQNKIQKYYLKGVSIKDLSMQLDISIDLIEMVLRNKGIEIVKNDLPRFRYYKRKRKKS